MNSDEILAVQEGDIVLCGSSYFWVHRIHEPSVPAAGGEVFEGRTYSHATGTWGELHLWHYNPGLTPHPLHVLDDKAREWIGFPPRNDRGTSVETRMFSDTEVPIPADARQPCSRCDRPMRLLDDLHLDEGDGSAMIGLRCDQCRIESCHYWTASDEVYEAVFGHRFGDDPDDEGDSDSGAPHEPLPSGGPTVQHHGTGAVYQQAVATLIRAADQVAEYRADLSAFADTLAGKKWGVEVTGPVQDMDTRLTALEGTYRDLAAQMNHQGDQGAAAYDQAPWVPGPEAVLA